MSAAKVLLDLDRRLDAATLRLGASPEQLQGIQARVERFETFELARARVCRWWPGHMPLMKAQLGAAATLLFSGVQHSIALFTMGESGSGKSMEIKAFTGDRHHERVLRIDKFTIPALLSAYGEAKSEDLEQSAMFRRVKHRIMVTPELARVFRGRTTGILEERFGELAGWLDGEGVVQWAGTHGQQGGEGDYTCVWLGCTTPFHLQAWRTMEKLGQRLLLYPAAHIGPEDEVPEEDLAEAVSDLREAARSVLDLLFGQQAPRSVKPWPRRPKEIDGEINRLTELLAAGHVIGTGVGSAEAPTRPEPAQRPAVRPCEAIARSVRSMSWPLGEVARIPQTRAWRCLRKIHHASYYEAEAHRLDVLRRHGYDGHPLNVYRCRHCGDWHVGRDRNAAAKQ